MVNTALKHTRTQTATAEPHVSDVLYIGYYIYKGGRKESINDRKKKTRTYRTTNAHFVTVTVRYYKIKI